jgi:hypothetical protein
MDNLHEGQHTFFIISQSAPLRMINISDEVCGEYQKHNVLWRISKAPCIVQKIKSTMYCAEYQKHNVLCRISKAQCIV